MSEEHRRNISKGHSTKASKEKASASQKARKRTPEERAKAAAALRARWADPDFRAIMAESRKRKIVTPETRAKLSASHKGLKRSKEHQAKLTAALRLRNISSKTRNIISAKMKALWTDPAYRAMQMEKKLRQACMAASPASHP